MSKKMQPTSFVLFLSLLITGAMLMTADNAFATGATTHAWPSFRHDLLNTGAATDSGYPTTNARLWTVDREFRAWDPTKRADSRGPPQNRPVHPPTGATTTSPCWRATPGFAIPPGNAPHGVLNAPLPSRTALIFLSSARFLFPPAMTSL